MSVNGQGGDKADDVWLMVRSFVFGVAKMILGFLVLSPILGGLWELSERNPLFLSAQVMREAGLTMFWLWRRKPFVVVVIVNALDTLCFAIGMQLMKLGKVLVTQLVTDLKANDNVRAYANKYCDGLVFGAGSASASIAFWYAAARIPALRDRLIVVSLPGLGLGAAFFGGGKNGPSKR